MIFNKTRLKKNANPSIGQNNSKLQKLIRNGSLLIFVIFSLFKLFFVIAIIVFVCLLFFFLGWW